MDQEHPMLGIDVYDPELLDKAQLLKLMGIEPGHMIARLGGKLYSFHPPSLLEGDDPEGIIELWPGV